MARSLPLLMVSETLKRTHHKKFQLEVVMVPRVRKLFVATTALAAFAWLATPADAQRGGGNHSQGARSAPSHPAQSAPSQHQSAPARVAPSSAPQSSAAPQQRYESQQRYAESQQRNFTTQSARPLPGARTAPPNATYGRAAVARPDQRFDSRGFSAGGSGHFDGRFSAPGHVINRRPIFVRPYYSFRPRFNLGFGLFVGYPVAYPFAYYDPYGFYNYDLGFAPGYYDDYDSGYGGSYGSSGSYATQVGGLAFDIDPVDAGIYIDGKYVGTAADFSSAQMPLTLRAGRHHVELKADGFIPVSFDITVVAGQVIPYEGTMQIR